ncbi:MAG: L-aspartate oxidase [Coriobacteriia bacterium]|nr:L-aspartate oxidase [Coriobacteriia bacterium]
MAAFVPEALDARYVVGFDTDTLPSDRCDVLVVGSGIAGLTAALHASEFGTVTLVTKSEVTDANTWYAQGGIAGAVGAADSVELHLADTLVVGQGICDQAVVRAVVSEAAEALAELETLGVRFDRAASGEVALAREGGHSLPRVLHSGDATGAEVQNTLSAVVRRAPGIRLVEDAFVVDLLTAEDRCVGALVMDRGSHAMMALRADAVVLATGGSGQMYRVTTNPLVATGDGVAAAWRAGAEIADMEFVQFHPTALDSDATPKFLITEALRGEGAYLLDCDLKRFMPALHPLAELAPRDLVSREIERVMHRCARPNVWLDARHLGAEFLARRFPTISEGCREAGYDLARDLVPVAPAAHYLIGGVRTDIDGRTSLPGLYAAGECSASGLHGANRLASNSLLEGLVFSRRIVRALERERVRAKPTRVAAEITTCGRADPDAARAALQVVMSRHAAVTRFEVELVGAAEAVAELAVGLGGAGPRAIETRNLLVNAALTVAGAIAREESRGTHFRTDRPERDDERWRGHLVWQRGAEPRFEPVTAEETITSQEGDR